MVFCTLCPKLGLLPAGTTLFASCVPSFAACHRLPAFPAPDTPFCTSPTGLSAPLANFVALDTTCRICGANRIPAHAVPIPAMVVATLSPLFSRYSITFLTRSAISGRAARRSFSFSMPNPATSFSTGRKLFPTSMRTARHALPSIVNTDSEVSHFSINSLYILPLYLEASPTSSSVFTNKSRLPVSFAPLSMAH